MRYFPRRPHLALANLLLWPLLLIFVASLEAHSLSLQGQPAGVSLQGLAADDGGLQFELRVPEYEVDAQGTVLAAGLTETMGVPDMPLLPYYTALIALPPEADATVVVEEVASRRQPVGPTIRRAPAEMAPISGEAAGLLPEAETAAAAPARSVDGVYPVTSYTLSEPRYYRDIRFVALSLFPLRYDGARGELIHTPQMEVTVHFEGESWQPLRPLANDDETVLPPLLAGQLLNPEQAQAWRSLPAELQAAQASLPAGKDAFKIEVDRDGIYEISYGDLQAAGMNVGAVDPATFEMMYRGEPVAYQYLPNGSGQWGPGAKIRFYGWDFDGSRLEKQFFDNNVYWLWAGGSATRVNAVDNVLSHPEPTSFRDSVTREPEREYSLTRTDLWELFPNEPDNWYWELFRKAKNEGPIAYTRTITLPTPALTGGDALLTVEYSHWSSYEPANEASAYLNGYPEYAVPITWSMPFNGMYYAGNQNVQATIPVTTLVDGVNEVHNLISSSTATGAIFYYLNRITVEYPRRFVAQGNQLIFHDATGPHTYRVSGFSEDNASNVLVWDISERQAPRAVKMLAGHITPDGKGGYVYQMGKSRSSDSAFIATTTANLLSPVQISRYSVADLEPAGGGAEWLAISYGGFMAQAERLATHRADPRFGGLETHVVDVKDVINQYGHGLPIPAAIRSYLTQALATWNPAPQYVLLLGDGNNNPRQLACEAGYECDLYIVDPDEPNYLLTDLVFKDRFIGMAPSDHTFGLLAGNDLVADVALGRLPVQTAAEAKAIVDKIIHYEELHLQPEAWQKNLLFVADNPDSGGDFCRENGIVAQSLPDSLTEIPLCLPDGSAAAVEALRADMSEQVNPPNGVTFLNYRGHGNVQYWGSGILTVADPLDPPGWLWFDNEPVVLLSMDCLDGNFAVAGKPALSESFLRLERVGSVAHWSSTGLGYTFEHTVLHEAFYQGLFEHGLTALGDAVNYAKLVYDQGNYHDSEIYSFTLQGDPAMQLLRPEVRVQQSVVPAVVYPGETANFALTVSNQGLYPGRVQLVDQLPAGFTVEDVFADVAVNWTAVGNRVTINLEDTLDWGEQATVTVVARAAAEMVSQQVTNVATATSSGLDPNPANNRSTLNVYVSRERPVYVPLIMRN